MRKNPLVLNIIFFLCFELIAMTVSHAEVVDYEKLVGNVYGKVIDASTDKGIPHAKIFLVEEALVKANEVDNNPEVFQSNEGAFVFPDISLTNVETTTNSKGEFLINSIPTPFPFKKYTIVAMAEGYDATILDQVRILPGASMSLKVEFSLTKGKNLVKVYFATDKDGSFKYRHEEIVVQKIKRPEEFTATSVSSTVYATREGLVGHTTANGHVIQERDRFVALPSVRSLCSKDGHEYEVRVSYGTETVTVPVWDVGPWNTKDDYWNPSSEREMWQDLPQGLPEAQAAFQDGYNGGKDQFGRTVMNPAGIDLADGTFWDDLGMINNDWVEVTYLWIDTPANPIFPETAIKTKDSTSPYATTKNAFMQGNQYNGQCTWYVYGRVIELAESGHLDSSAATIMYNAFWGETGRNAKNWPDFLGGEWTPTTSTPLPMDKRKPGMIAVWIGGTHGHVGFVEEISADKSRYRLTDFNRGLTENYKNAWYNFVGTSDYLLGTYPSFYQLPLPDVGPSWPPPNYSYIKLPGGGVPYYMYQRRGSTDYKFQIASAEILYNMRNQEGFTGDDIYEYSQSDLDKAVTKGKIGESGCIMKSREGDPYPSNPDTDSSTVFVQEGTNTLRPIVDFQTLERMNKGNEDVPLVPKTTFTGSFHNYSVGSKYGPNLTVQSISAPSSAILGESIEVSCTEKNDGDVWTEAHRNKVYLSSDSTITSSDHQLYVYDIGSNISPNSTRSFSASGYIPSDISPGTYYIGVVLDVNDSEKETDEEDNNDNPSQIEILSPPPSTPTLNNIANGECGDYTVSWNSVSGATNYTLQEKKNSGSWQQIYSDPNTQKSFSGKPAGTYSYQVKACNTECSGWSGTKSVTVTGAPSTPTLYSVSNPDCGNYTVSWSSVSNATSYILEQKKDSGSWQQVYSGSETQKSFSSKEKGTYCYRVKATNACDESSLSNEQCATVTGKPDIPTLYSIDNSDRDGNYIVSWSSVSSATSYTLQEKKDSGSWTDVYNGSGTQKSISGKTAGIYCYHVRASNNCGDSSWSDEQCTTVGDDLVAYAGADKTICNPNNGGTHAVQIGGAPTASGGAPDYEYNWTPSTGLNNTSIANPTASPTTTTTYTVTITDANNATATDSITVFINPELIANAGENVTIDEGESTTVGGSPTASGGTPDYEYNWTPSTGLNNPNIANPVASPDVTTTYAVAVTDAIGCQNSDSVTVTVGESCFYVDIDCDGDVDVFDILLVAAVWGCEGNDACYDEKCDVNNDEAIDVFDILEVAKHWGEESPFETVAPSLITVDKTSYPATVHLQASTPQITVGDSFNIELLALLPFAVQAFEFQIAYSQNAYASNKPVVRFETFEGGNLLTDKNGTVIHLGPKIDHAKGKIAYGGILLGKNVNGKSPDRLANITITALLPGDCQIAISDIKLVSSDYNLIPIKIANPIKLHIKTKPPKQTALLQNYPNPFNPETWIPYQLADAGDVKIQIYDVSGKLVRTFDLGYQDAGYYQDKASAIYWDGKNEYGEAVASNVYFYTIITENFKATRKMMMLK